METAIKDSAYTAALWEHPTLCLSLFGVQYHSAEGQQRYEASGIAEEMNASFASAAGEGLLLNREMMSAEGPIILQYWRSYEDLDQWARKQPHSGWWRWLLENSGNGIGFYHEIYQVKTGEAIFEKGTKAVGPALFSTLQNVKAGEGKSKDRQKQFSEAAKTLSELTHKKNP